MTEITTKDVDGTRCQKRNHREKVNTYNADHRFYSGTIYDSDFYHHTYLADVASRIASDMRFDEQCRRASENRKRQKERKIKGDYK